jgi:hypothetical protein
VSLKALNAVWEESRADKSDLLVLLALADWSDPYGRCYPSWLQIARKARISRASVARSINRLIELGELERVSYGHESTSNEDDNDGPVSIRAQARNAYRILLVRPRKADEVVSSRDRQVVSPRDGEVVSPRDGEVVSPRDHLAASAADQPQVVSPRDHLSIAGGLKNDAKVVSNATSHIRNKPSVEPSEELKAGAAPRPITENAENPNDNVGVVTKLVHEALDVLGEAVSDGELREAVKDRIAFLNRRARRPEHKIAYDSTVVIKAVESARWQRRRPRLA